MFFHPYKKKITFTENRDIAGFRGYRKIAELVFSRCEQKMASIPNRTNIKQDLYHFIEEYGTYLLVLRKSCKRSQTNIPNTLVEPRKKINTFAR